ncbi:polymorphic toxin type 15 domain-containing protein [Nocardia sp. NPDC058658]|uniref:polymorphic toxin type 15 domain-containing protein n=1 Tax=Nocardia sp. NPDC058658 TaxID=3346580 RepID=UPI0036675D9D
MTTAPEWVSRGIAWRASLTPAKTESPAESDTKPRVFNISVSSPADAARQLNRIWNGRKLFDDARQSPLQADAIDAPFDLPVQRETDAQSDPNAKENLANKLKERPRATDTPSSTPPPPGFQTSTPANSGESSTPTPSTSNPTPVPLQDLGILPGGQYPATEMNFPVLDPESMMPVVVATTLGSGGSLTQESSTSNGVTVTETTAKVPGRDPIVTTTISDGPAIEAVVECTVPVPLTAPGVVPPSITHPETIFRTNSSYSSQQLEADLRAFDAGRPVWAGPNRPADYEVARARLAAAMYTPTEQFNDLVWAQHEPRNQAETEERFAALQRLNQAGIPWLDPTIEEWVAARQITTIAEDPFAKVDNTRPAMYSPAELRQQALEASRTALTLNDLKQGINGFLVDSTVGPAIVLWDAAHDRGDHSAAEITWAAAELGINVASILPGLGTLTGAAAKAGLRRIAPKIWDAMATADNAVDATRIGRAAHEQQLTDAVNNHRRRPVADGEVPRTPDPTPAPRPNNPVTPTPHTQGTPPTRPLPLEDQTTRLPVRDGGDAPPASTFRPDPEVPPYSPFSPYLNPGRFDDLKAAAIRFSDRVWDWGQRQFDLSPAGVTANNSQATFSMSIFSASSRLPSAPLRPGLIPRRGLPPAPLRDSAGQLRPRASGPPLRLDFNYGTRPSVRGKPQEMVDQLTGQIDGLNNLTAAEVLHNLSTVRRRGIAQKKAREEYEILATEREIENAKRLALLNPDALNGMTPVAYAKKLVKDRMEGMAALHEPDIIAGGADVIRRDSNGLPVLGDRGVNSSIGSQWSHGNGDAVRKYAEELVAAGKGHELMNVVWRLNP